MVAMPHAQCLRRHDQPRARKRQLAGDRSMRERSTTAQTIPQSRAVADDRARAQRPSHSDSRRRLNSVVGSMQRRMRSHWRMRAEIILSQVGARLSTRPSRSRSRFGIGSQHRAARATPASSAAALGQANKAKRLPMALDQSSLRQQRDPRMQVRLPQNLDQVGDRQRPVKERGSAAARSLRLRAA